MMEVSYEPELMNAMLNSPKCREEHFPPGWLDEHPGAMHDVSPLLAAGGFCVIGDHMGWLFNLVDVGVYEVHTCIMDGYRGANCMKHFREAVDLAFLETPAMELLTRCYNKGNELMAKRVGGQHLYTTGRIWGDQRMAVYSLPISRWAAQNKRYMKEGQWLHDEFERDGTLHGEHGDSDEHLQYAGIAVEMGLRGQPYKGAWVYNVWASMNGYDGVAIMCADPLVMRTVVRESKQADATARAVDYLVTNTGLERV